MNVYPNPFNPSSVISFDLNAPQIVNLIIYDIYGYEVKKIANQFYSQGSHQIKWVPESSISSGLYFVRLETGNSTLTRKLLYLK